MATERRAMAAAQSAAAAAVDRMPHLSGAPVPSSDEQAADWEADPSCTGFVVNILSRTAAHAVILFIDLDAPAKQPNHLPSPKSDLKHDVLMAMQDSRELGSLEAMLWQVLDMVTQLNARMERPPLQLPEGTVQLRAWLEESGAMAKMPAALRLRAHQQLASTIAAALYDIEEGATRQVLTHDI